MAEAHLSPIRICLSELMSLNSVLSCAPAKDRRVPDIGSVHFILRVGVLLKWVFFRLIFSVKHVELVLYRIVTGGIIRVFPVLNFNRLEVAMKSVF